MGGGNNEQQNVLVPDTGAAQYWYVDPRATGVPGSNTVESRPFNPVEYIDEQGHLENRKPLTTAIKKTEKDSAEELLDALRRLGESAAGVDAMQRLPEGTTPSF